MRRKVSTFITSRIDWVLVISNRDGDLASKGTSIPCTGPESCRLGEYDFLANIREEADMRETVQGLYKKRISLGTFSKDVPTEHLPSLESSQFLALINGI